MQNADDFIQLMKQQADSLLDKDEKLQQFLVWIKQKSISLNAPYKPAAIRALYSKRDNIRRLSLAYALDPSLDRYLSYALECLFDSLYIDLQLHNMGAGNDNRDRVFFRCLSIVRDLTRTINASSDLNLDLNLIVTLYIDIYLDLPYTLNLYSADAHVPVFESARELEKKLQQLNKELPKQSKQTGIKSLMDFLLKANNQAWTEQLRAVMIEHRNIGHDWQFSEHQKLLIQQYYNANKLLVDCMNISEVSPELRQEIEDTLLLPIAEIEKRQQRIS